MHIAPGSKMIQATLILLSIAVTTALGSCPVSIPKTNVSSYQSLGNDCYYFAVEDKKRFDAELECLDADGYLASVHSKEENEFIRKHVAETYRVDRSVYIGLEQAVGKFFWLDHSEVDFKNFEDNGEELYSSYASDILICTILDSKTGYWHPYRCFWQSEPLPYVCKFKGANTSEDDR